MTLQECLLQVYRAAHITGTFTLRSGAVSNEYFDKYLFEADPVLLKEIARRLAGMLPENIDVLAGLELGGVPLATALSFETGIHTAFVRKKAKEYGTCKLAEGAVIKDKRVLIVEDVVTSGGQVVLSAQDMRDRGALITDALCVIDREAGGRDRLAEIGVTLRPLFTMSQLKQAAENAL